MKRYRTAALSVIGFAGLLTACGTLHVDSWVNPEYPNRPIGKTMVLGVGRTAEISHQYENLFIDRLTKRGVEADSMHRHINREEMVSEDEIVRILKEHACTSILVTRLLTEKERTYDGGAYPDYYWHYYGFYSSAFDAKTLESLTEYHLETNLYDVETRSLVWSGHEVVYSDRSDQSNMKDVIRALIKNLQRENMVPR